MPRTSSVYDYLFDSPSATMEPPAAKSSADAIAATDGQGAAAASSVPKPIVAESSAPADLSAPTHRIIGKGGAPPAAGAQLPAEVDDSADASLQKMLRDQHLALNSPGITCGATLEVASTDSHSIATALTQMTALMAQIMPTMALMKTFMEGAPSNTQASGSTQMLIDVPDPVVPHGHAGATADPISPELMQSLESTAAKFRNEMVSLTKLCAKIDKLTNHDVFFKAHRVGQGLANPAGMPPGMRACSVNTSAEYMKPFSSCTQDDFVWPTHFSTNTNRAEALQIMYASYMHFQNTIDLEAHLEKKEVSKKTANPEFFTECLVEEARDYEKSQADAVARAPAGLERPAAHVLDLSVIEEWSKARYAKIFKECSAPDIPRDKDHDEKMAKVLDSRPEKLLQSTLEKCVQDMIADQDEEHVMITKEQLRVSLAASLTDAGVNWTSQATQSAKEKTVPWMKGEKRKWDSSQWAQEDDTTWEPKKKGKGKGKGKNSKNTSWPASGSGGWGSQSGSVFHAATAPAGQQIPWQQLPVPPPPQYQVANYW
jgi:hypothetical protein